MAIVEYPKWKYHSALEALIVQTPEQEKLLGPGWKDSPADVIKTAEPKPKVKASK